MKMQVTERSCIERTMLLLKDFKKDEGISQRESGLEEDELNALTSLLTNIRKLSEIPIESTVQKLYTKSNRKEAEKEREKALVEISENSDDSEDMVEKDYVAEENIPENEAEGVTLAAAAPVAADVAVGTAAQKPQDLQKVKRIRKGDVIDYLENNLKRDLEFRKEELEVRKFEAKTKRIKFEAQMIKDEMDFKAKMTELEIRKEAEKTLNEERSTMTKALLEFLAKK